ncbi:MAG TPA: succinate dehydrogenase, hydrophobic membrane anchor protein [Gammaproteobacteria bacterium]|nr:succinate dehydrogenase, hydrophobic membrane anchor protein [Gammaproteobacteria bacterium]
MSKSRLNLRTPLKNARGLGSAQTGVGHWWAQRMTALALIPLSLWFVASLLWVVQAGYADAQAWLTQPWHAGGIILLLLMLFYHSWLGLQVVVEDYIHKPVAKFTTLISLKFIHFVLAVASIFMVLRMTFA